MTSAGISLKMYMEISYGNWGLRKGKKAVFLQYGTSRNFPASKPRDKSLCFNMGSAYGIGKNTRVMFQSMSFVSEIYSLRIKTTATEESKGYSNRFSSY